MEKGRDWSHQHTSLEAVPLTLTALCQQSPPDQQGAWSRAPQLLWHGSPHIDGSSKLVSSGEVWGYSLKAATDICLSSLKKPYKNFSLSHNLFKIKKNFFNYLFVNYLTFNPNPWRWNLLEDVPTLLRLRFPKGPHPSLGSPSVPRPLGTEAHLPLGVPPPLHKVLGDHQSRCTRCVTLL